MAGQGVADSSGGWGGADEALAAPAAPSPLSATKPRAAIAMPASGSAPVIPVGECAREDNPEEESADVTELVLLPGYCGRAWWWWW